MSRENVEAFKQAVDAINRRDVEALLEKVDRDVEWHPGLGALLGGEATVHRGHDGVRELLRDLYEAFAEFDVKVSEIRDLDDRIVAIGRIRGRGTESGADTDSPSAYLVQFKDSKAILVRTYLDPKEALEAVGLSE
jgi:ketosteroid isomerase-like protein